MAIKKRDQIQKSKLLEVLTTEYRWENLILGIVAIFAAAVSVMILDGTLKIAASFPILGEGNNGTIFAACLLVVSLLGIILVIFPYLYSAFPEIRKIEWARGKGYLDSATRTFVFIIILAMTLLMYDLIITKIVGVLS